MILFMKRMAEVTYPKLSLDCSAIKQIKYFCLKDFF